MLITKQQWGILCDVWLLQNSYMHWGKNNFLVSDEDAVGIIRDNRFEYQILPYAYNEKNKEVDVLISLLKQKK